MSTKQAQIKEARDAFPDVEFVPAGRSSTYVRWGPPTYYLICQIWWLRGNHATCVDPRYVGDFPSLVTLLESHKQRFPRVWLSPSFSESDLPCKE